MDERKNDVREMTNEEYRVDSPDYGELIIEMVHRIKSQSALKYIYTVISSYIKKAGVFSLCFFLQEMTLFGELPFGHHHIRFYILL